jgi:tyrosinase
MDLNTRVHWTGQFLPWHRWFIHTFEKSLKEKCGYTGVAPYWNWTIDAPNFYESSWWKDSDPVSGLGGWGDPNNDYRVPDGALSNFQISYPGPHTIRRNFTLYPFQVPFPIFSKPQKLGNASISAYEVNAVLDAPAGDFKAFQVAFEAPEGSHSGPHALTGGDLAGTCPETVPDCIPGFTWTPNDPLFYLHHAMVDKIWYDWQSRDPINVRSFDGGSVQQTGSLDAYKQYPNGGPPYLSLESIMPTDGMFPEVTIGDVMDTTGGFLCYVYE